MQLEVIIPLSKQLQTDPSPVRKTFENLHSSHYYYNVKMSISNFLDLTFLTAHIRTGSFYAISHSTKVDSENTFVLLPTGKLILSVDKDTYEHLGLEGKPSSFHKKRRYSIIYFINFSSFTN